VTDRPPQPRRCPICQKQFDPESSPALPFCSHRCRQIDLGRWLSEQYSLPIEKPLDDEPFEGD